MLNDEEDTHGEAGMVDTNADGGLLRDGKPPIYGSDLFRRRYRMQPSLFNRVLEGMIHNNDYFVQKSDALGVMGLSPEQKITCALRMLAYGMPADACDECTKLAETTALETLRNFCASIINVFGPEYLRAPTKEDLSRLLARANKRGFPGMLGSLDCMHWEWKNCPTAWHGHYTGHYHRPTIIFEAVASFDLWIWHAFFGMPWSNNDINVLSASPLFDTIATGTSPSVEFTVNGHQYDMGYYLADGIYPKWATIVQTISQPQDLKKKLFATRQESYRKDVERAFGALQGRFAIVKGPSRGWDFQSLKDIMLTCIILHNMIVEDEWVDNDEDFEDGEDLAVGSEYDRANELVEVNRDSIQLSYLIGRRQGIRDSVKYHTLRNDLVEHLWAREGQRYLNT